MTQAIRWYALKVFYNRYSAIEATLSRDGVQSYIPMKTRRYPQPNGEVIEKRVPAVAMLMFLRCTDEYIDSLNEVLHEKAMVYHHPGTQIPAPIPDREMEQFILLTTTLADSFEPMPYNAALITGELPKYRVMEGSCLGIEGFYRRIHKERRLIVPLGQLLMLVSTYHIPQRYLQPVLE